MGLQSSLFKQWEDKVAAVSVRGGELAQPTCGRQTLRGLFVAPPFWGSMHFISHASLSVDGIYDLFLANQTQESERIIPMQSRSQIS